MTDEQKRQFERLIRTYFTRADIVDIFEKWIGKANVEKVLTEAKKDRIKELKEHQKKLNPETTHNYPRAKEKIDKELLFLK